MSLNKQRIELIDNIKENISILATGVSADEVGYVYENLCFQFEAFAILDFLLDHDFEGFYRNLAFSIYSRQNFLENISFCEQKGQNFYASTSRTNTLFILAILNDLELTKKIIDISPVQWIKDGEYEDDFLYHKCLQHLCLKNKAPLSDLLKTFEMAVCDSTKFRFLLCQALFEKDLMGFEEAFNNLILQHEDMLSQKATDNYPETKAQENVFIEGLGLLKLAELWGIEHDIAYKYCPDIADGFSGFSLPNNFFLEL